MSMLGVSQLASVPLEPRIPLSAQIVGRQLPVQDVVLSRREITVPPIGKSTALNPLEQIDIRVSSANDFVVPSSFVLEFDLVNLAQTSGGADSDDATFDDIPAVAILDRLDVKVGGQLLERLEEVGSKTTAEIYAHASKDYYNFVCANLMGAYKFNDQDGGSGAVGGGLSILTFPTISGADATNAGVGTIQNYYNAIALGLTAQSQSRAGVVARQQLATAGAYTAPVNYVANTTAGVPAVGAGRQFYPGQGVMRCQVPLALVCGFCQSLELFPLSFVSELNFLFTLALANKAMYSPTASDVLNYRVDNVRLHYDAVEMSQDFIRATAKLLSSGDESMGFHKPIQTYTTRKISLPTLTSGSATKVDGVATIATPFLNSLLIWTRKSSVAVNEWNTSGMPCPFDDVGTSRTDANIQIQIGSTRFPYTQPLDSAVAVYAHNLREMGEIADVKGTSNVNTFRTLIDSTTTAGQFYVYQNFHSLVGTESQAEPLELESFDTNQFAGQIVYSGNYDTLDGTGWENVVLAKHSKVFALSGGSARIMG